MNNKNFGLSEDKFNELCSKLKRGDEHLFEQIFLSQFEDAIKHLIYKYNASSSEAYDMCMDALINFRKLILQDKVYYGNLRHLFNRIASQHYLKLKSKTQKIVSDEELPTIKEELIGLDNDEMEILNKAWDRLGKECKYILKQFYYNNVKLYDVAEHLNKSAAATRKHKERCMNALRLNFRQFSQ